MSFSGIFSASELAKVLLGNGPRLDLNDPENGWDEARLEKEQFEREMEAIFYGEELIEEEEDKEEKETFFIPDNNNLPF